MAQVTSIETITYNGFTFPVETKLRCRCQQRYDDAGRTVVTNVYTFTATALIAVTGTNPSSDNSTSLEEIRKKLTKPGKALIVRNTGFGDFFINTETPDGGGGGGAQPGQGQIQNVTIVRDVAWGPKPREISWEPLGVYAAQIVWQVDVHIPDCDDAAYRDQLMAYNTTVSFSKDMQGYVSRTISGYIEIPMTRRVGADDDRTLDDNVDDYWAAVQPTVPKGYRRDQEQRSISSDKRRLNFSVTDTELPENIPPPDVVHVRASHSTSTHSKALLKQVSTLRASYTMRKGANKARSFSLFLRLLRDRWEAQVRAGATAIIPLALSMDEPDIYGREAGNFAMSYSYIMDGGGGPALQVIERVFRNYVSRSGLWTKPSNISYPAWATSMLDPRGPVWGPYGVSGLRADITDDRIIDLCDAAAPPRVRGKFFAVGNPAISSEYIAVRVPDSGYLYYRISLEMRAMSTVVFPKKVNKDKHIPSGLLNAALVLLSAGTFPPVFFGDKPGTELSDAQERTPRDAEAILSFDMIRVGSPPDIPILSRFADLKQSDVHFVTNRVKGMPDANIFGVIAYRVVGRGFYKLTRVPNSSAVFPPDFYIQSPAGDVKIVNSMFSV